MTEDDLAHLAHLAKAMDLTKQITDKVDRLLEPLAREMKIMAWQPEYQAILWEAVMLEAKTRWEKCQT